MKRILLMCLGVMAWEGVLGQFFSSPPTIDGTIDVGYSTSGAWSLGWDDTYLYVRYSGGAGNEPAIMYFDVNPIVPVSGGTNSNGSLTGQANWSITPTLPFRSDFMIYWESGFAEYRTSNASGGWTGATTIGISDRSNTGNQSREIRLAWTNMGLSSRPASFNWYGYANSQANPGFIFSNAPGENPGGFVGGPRINYYFNISNTGSSGTTNPFSQKSFEHRGSGDIFLTGANTFFDITNNSNSTTDRIILENNSNNFTIDVTGTAHLYGGIVVNSGETFRINENANVIINPNGFIANNSSTVTYNSSNSTLSYQTGGSYNVSGEWPIVNPPSNIVVNSAGTNLIISDTRIASGNLTISTGCSTTVNATGRMTVSGNLTNNGNLTISATNESTYAQLLTNGTVTGNVTFQRAVTGTTAGWRFFSPVTSGTLSNLGVSPVLTGSANVIRLNTANPNAWVAQGGAGADALVAGRGYALYFGGSGVNNNTVATTLSTTGSIQSSNVSVTGLSDGNGTNDFGWSLVGNPFAAGITFDNVANTRTNLDNAYYIWDPTANSGNGAYASYVNVNGNGTSNPGGALNGIIPPGQGFLVKANAASPALTFGTAARTTGTPNNQLRTATNFTNRMYVRVTNTQNSHYDETAILSAVGAQPQFESANDAYKLNSFNAAAVNLSSVSADGKRLSINATDAFGASTILPLKLECTQSVLMTIEANLQEVDANLPVMLEDRHLNRRHDLRTGAYTFAHIPAQADRFVIRFAPLSTSVMDVTKAAHQMYVVDDQLFVKGEGGAFVISCTDLLGRQLFSWNLTDAGQYTLPALATGTYIFRLKDAQGTQILKINR